jgi:hypothetical protein
LSRDRQEDLKLHGTRLYWGEAANTTITLTNRLNVRRPSFADIYRRYTPNGANNKARKGVGAKVQVLLRHLDIACICSMGWQKDSRHVPKYLQCILEVSDVGLCHGICGKLYVLLRLI